MDISQRVLNARIEVCDYRGTHMRWAIDSEAVGLIASGYVPVGRKRRIYCIWQPLPRETVVAIAAAGKRAKARDMRARLPVPQPMTTTAESWDNPPRVLKFRPIARKTREIFLSALLGRAGILEPCERRRMREALREAA